MVKKLDHILEVATFLARFLKVVTFYARAESSDLGTSCKLPAR